MRGGIAGVATKTILPAVAIALVAAAAEADQRCVLSNGPTTIFRTGTLNKVITLGRENYPTAVRMFGACPSVPTGTELGILDFGLLSSTVIVKSGPQAGCSGDLEADFISCVPVDSDAIIKRARLAEYMAEGHYLFHKCRNECLDKFEKGTAEFEDCEEECGSPASGGAPRAAYYRKWKTAEYHRFHKCRNNCLDRFKKGTTKFEGCEKACN